MPVGRPPLPEATVDLLTGFLATMSPRKAVVAAASQGVQVSRSTCQRLAAGTYRQKPASTSRLKAGEVALKTPERCENGHLTTVRPCRTCAAYQTMDRFRELRKLAQAAPPKNGRDPRVLAALDYGAALEIEARRSG